MPSAWKYEPVNQSTILTDPNAQDLMIASFLITSTVKFGIAKLPKNILQKYSAFCTTKNWA